MVCLVFVFKIFVLPDKQLFFHNIIDKFQLVSFVMLVTVEIGKFVSIEPTLNPDFRCAYFAIDEVVA